MDELIHIICCSPRLRFLELAELENLGRSYGSERVVMLPELEHIFLDRLNDDLIPLCRFLLPSVGPNTEVKSIEDWMTYHESLWETASERMWLFQAPQELIC